MRWHDRVYDEIAIDDPAVLRLFATPTVQRLRGIKQAGPSIFAHPHKTVTRLEHSLGVYHLLGRLGADRREQVAGLLHDISHTAFSHASDFLDDGQSLHEQIKHLFLSRPDLVEALAGLGYRPEEFADDRAFLLLERPLPALCADRLDYFFRDGLSVGLCTPEFVARALDALIVLDATIGFSEVEIAREVAARYAGMNECCWSGPVEAFIYNEFAEAMREAMRIGALRHDDLLADDQHVLGRLREARSPLIASTLERISHVRPEDLEGYVPRVKPKRRRIDPPVLVDSTLVLLSKLDGGLPSPVPSGGLGHRHAS